MTACLCNCRVRFIVYVYLPRGYHHYFVVSWTLLAAREETCCVPKLLLQTWRHVLTLRRHGSHVPYLHWQWRTTPQDSRLLPSLPTYVGLDRSSGRDMHWTGSEQSHRSPASATTKVFFGFAIINTWKKQGFVRTPVHKIDRHISTRCATSSHGTVVAVSETFRVKLFHTKQQTANQKASLILRSTIPDLIARYGVCCSIKNCKRACGRPRATSRRAGLPAFK
ncbi:hypothetical protein BHE74_00014763 [Ensete ventricosum]|nr:hypothetical protein BHE74_00014763 [Ensete ventricosum]